jgi:CheY-like chemotaxis protein
MATPFRAPKVLVVEDDPLLRMVTVDEFEFGGLIVVHAAGADDAVLLLERDPDIRVLITDIDMPGSMDGLALARAVRDRWPPVQIIVVSGHMRPRTEDLPSGARFFHKPVDHREMFASVREWML